MSLPFKFCHDKLCLEYKRILVLVYFNPLRLDGQPLCDDYRLPTQEDFNGAMTAVMRLQDTYDLQPHELASGNLGKDKSLSMNGKIENNDVVGFVQIFRKLTNL